MIVVYCYELPITNDLKFIFKENNIEWEKVTVWKCEYTFGSMRNTIHWIVPDGSRANGISWRTLAENIAMLCNLPLETIDFVLC